MVNLSHGYPVCSLGPQCLATVILATTLVRSTLRHDSLRYSFLRLFVRSRQHGGLSTHSSTLRDQATNTYCRPVPALQHLVQVRLAVRTSDYIDIPSVNPMYFKNQDINLPTTSNTSYHHRSSSCFSTNFDFSIPTTTILAIDITHTADYNNIVN